MPKKLENIRIPTDPWGFNTPGAKHLVRILFLLTFLFGFGLFGLRPSHALAHPVDNDLAIWAPVVLQLSPTDRLRLNFQVESRTDQNTQQFDALLLMPSVQYEVLPQTHLGVGYVRLFDDPGSTGEEHRVTPFVTYQGTWQKVTLDSRLMTEVRYFNQRQETSIRGRLRANLTYPLGTTPYFLLCSNEFFLNLNHTDSGPQKGFDQHRFLLGLGRALPYGANAVMGYMVRYNQGRRGKRDRVDHILYGQLVVPVRSS